jgi:hypothetical protein
MAHRINCKTLFDITATGVRSHYKSSRIPFVDDNGDTINNIDAWHYARNQQRNWETLNQLISLRVLPDDITNPVIVTHNATQYWQFDFSIESIETITLGDNPVGALIQDCRDVPMILDLTESSQIAPTLIPDGPNPNIWFWCNPAK